MHTVCKIQHLLLGLFLTLVLHSTAQQLYNPQLRYDAPEGLFDTDSLRTLSIQFYDLNYHDTLVANWYADNGRRLPASVTLSNGITLDSVATRYKGNSTFNIPEGMDNPKLPLNLDFNDLIGGQQLMDYKKVKLANAFFDPTFAKEITAYNIYRRYLPTPEANLINVEVQGNLLGLYVNTESIGKQFLTKHFDEKDGVLIKCDPIQQFGQPGPTGSSDLAWLGADSSLYFNSYSLKSDYGWNALVDLIDKLNNNPEQLDQVLNIDRVLWAFAVNMALTNLDTYNGLYQHNYYLYQTGDGLFQMIPWDVSESFLGALMGSNPDPNLLYEYDPYNGYNCWWHPLISQLISDPNSFYGQLYTAHLRTIIEESLDANTIGNYVNQLQTLGYSSADADNYKLFDMFTYNYNVDNPLVLAGFSAGGITSTVNIRKDFLVSYPEIALDAPIISEVELITNNNLVYVTANVFGADSVELMTTTNTYGSKFQKKLMYDDGTNGDAIALDGIYTAELPYQNNGVEVKFYTRAFDSDAISLNPARAEYEFYWYSATSSVPITEKSTLVSVYPNPSRGVLTILGNQSESVQLINSYGVEVLSVSCPANESQLDISHLPNGVYMVRVGDSFQKVTKID